jgi:hypothetical protein
VRLDTMSAYPHDAQAQRMGQGLQGFRYPPENSVVAWQLAAQNSVDIWIVGLGSTGWTLGRRHDQLRGIAWQTFDIVDVVDTLGPATGWRVNCP